MSIFIDASTKLLVQGITGRDGSFHARAMMEYGTNEKEALEILKNAGFSASTSMDEVVQRAVEIAA